MSEEGSWGPLGLLRSASELSVCGDFFEFCKRQNVNKAAASPRSWQRIAYAWGQLLEASAHATSTGNKEATAMASVTARPSLQVTLNPPPRKHTHHPRGSPCLSLWSCRKVTLYEAMAQTLSWASNPVWCLQDTHCPFILSQQNQPSFPQTSLYWQ